MAILSLILFWTYLLASCKRGGIPSCLSATHYVWPQEYQFTFPAFMAMQSLLLNHQLMSALGENYEFLAFLLTILVCTIGITPYQDDKFKYKIHCACTLLAMSIIIIMYIVAKPHLWFIPFFMCLTALRQNWLLGIEIAFFHSAYLLCWL